MGEKMGDMDPDRLKQGQNAMKAAQSGGAQAEGQPKRKKGVLPAAREYAKKPFQKEFWMGNSGTNQADNVRDKAKEKHDAVYNSGEEAQPAQGGVERKSNKIHEGETYNETLVAFVDAITRGHSRTEEDEPNKIFIHVTDENFIKAIEKRIKDTSAETEGFQEFYREDMLKVRAGLAKKLRNKNVTKLSFQEIDVLLVTMLKDESGAETFLDFLHDVAKINRTPDMVGAFIGNTLLALRTVKSTDEAIHKSTEGIEQLGPLMGSSIAQEYFEKNSYPIIREAVKEFKSRLPEYVVEKYEIPEGIENEEERETLQKMFGERRNALNNATKKRLVDSFRQILLSDPLVIEDVDEFGKKMPVTYKKDIADKVEEIKTLIRDINEFKGSELRKERLDKRLAKLKYEVPRMDDIDENLRQTFTNKLEELGRLYEKKKGKIENVKKTSIQMSSLPRELKEDDKKKIEEFNHAGVELEEVNSDIELLIYEVDKEPKKDDKAIKIAKDVIKKLKESVTEEGITKDQYVIAAIVYEGGLKNIGDLAPSRKVNIDEKRRLDRAVKWVLEKLTINLDIEEERILLRKWWRNENGGINEKRYNIAKSLSIVLWPVYGSHFSRWLKKNWYMKAFGFGITGAIAEDRKRFSDSKKRILRNENEIKEIGTAEDIESKEKLKSKEIENEILKAERKVLKAKKTLRWIAWPVVMLGTWITVAAVIDAAPLIGTKHWSERRKDEKGWIMPRIARALNTSRESFWEIASPIPMGWPWQIKSWKVAEGSSEGTRKRTEMSILGNVNLTKTEAKNKVNPKDVKNMIWKEYLDATKDKEFMLQAYYPGIAQSEIKEKGHLKALKGKKKEYKKQLEWLQEHQEVADFLAERRFAVKLIDYAVDGEQIGKEPNDHYGKDGKTVVVDFAKKTDEYKKMKLKLNPNKTPEFIAELMALEQGIELVDSKVNKEMKNLDRDSKAYRDMAHKHGETKVISAIEGSIIGLIINAMSIEENEAKEARKELAGYGIGFNEEGKLKVNNNEKLRTAVVENIVKKIEEYGIEYFNEEMKVSKAEINHRYLHENVRNWEGKEYLLPKPILGYMNTYGITSVENAEFLMANPDVVEWLGNTTTRGHAVAYIPEDNVEKVINMFREKAKESTDGVGVVTILSDKKRFTIKADIVNKALAQKLAIDTADEYRIHKENERIAEELGEKRYPNSQELINYLRNNEVKNDWFEYLYGEKTHRDKTEVKNELLRYLEGQKKELASTRANRIEEDIQYIEEEIKAVQAEYDLLAETEEEKNYLGLRLMELGEKKENLEQEKEDPEAYLNGIINYIKHGVKEEETEGVMTEEALAFLAMERESKKAQAIEYLENARKEKDIKHMLSTYRADTAAVMVIDGQLDDFIRYAIKHIENGGRASDFDAYGNNEMNRRYLEHAKKEGYLKSSLAEVSMKDESGVEVKVKIDMEALDMCEPITMNFDNVFEHMKEKKEYQKALEKEGEDGLKNAARAFIYKKMEKALEEDKAKNELMANGVRFNAKIGKAEIADAEKLANYIYEGKIKEIGQTSGISEELILNSQGLFKEIDEMISKNAKHVAKKKKYGEGQVLDAVHGYLIAQLAMVQSGDIAMQNKLEENGIEFNEDGMPGMTDRKKANKYIMSEILKPMRQFGIENIENKTDKMKQGFEVIPGETMGEDKMETSSGEEDKYGKEIVLDGITNSGDFTVYLDKNEEMTVIFSNEHKYQLGTIRPGDAVKALEEHGKYKDISRDVKLSEKDGKAVYELEATYTKGINKKYKVHYYIMGGKIDNAEKI